LSGVSGLSLKSRRVTKSGFRLCSACQPRSQAGLCLYTFILVSIQNKPTFERLRYLLGGCCPSKTGPHSLFPRFFLRLDLNLMMVGVPLTAPLCPKAKLHRLPTTLCTIKPKSMSEPSKAPRVFSSRCQYPASSRGLHFHRAPPRDSPPVVTPFMRSGTYPERNCATFGRSGLPPTFTGA
jgi:hypothetical protein